MAEKKLEDMTAGEALSTPEGRSALLEAFKEKMESDPALLETIDKDSISFLKGASETGLALLNRKEDVITLAALAETISGMTEAEGRSYIERIFDDLFSGNNVSEKGKREIVDICYRKSATLALSNDKVTRELFVGDYFPTHTEPLLLNVAPRKKSEVKVTAQVFIMAEDEETYLPKTLTAYDQLVFDGVCTILQNGFDTFTTDQLYEVIAGKGSRSPQVKAAISRSLNKMRNTRISIDWTEQARMLKLPMQTGDYVNFESYFLPLEIMRAKINGTHVVAWHLIKEPVLYVYTRKVGQICTIDKKLLDVVTVSNTETNLVIKTYLLKRIEVMYNNQLQSKTIKYNSLYAHLNFCGNKVEQQRIRDTVDKMLEDWKHKGYIKAYKKKRDGRAYSGVELTLYPSNPFKLKAKK